MKAAFFTAVLLVCLRLSRSECEQLDLCSCRDSESGKVISLHSLADTTGPAFSLNETNYVYFYNPCLNFTLDKPGNCSDVAVCQDSIAQRFKYDLGKQPTASFSTLNSSSNVAITYIGDATFSPAVRHFHRRTRLDEEATSGTFTFVEESPLGTYNFKLTSKCSCPGGCSVNRPRHQLALRRVPRTVPVASARTTRSSTC